MARRPSPNAPVDQRSIDLAKIDTEIARLEKLLTCKKEVLAADERQHALDQDPDLQQRLKGEIGDINELLGKQRDLRFRTELGEVGPPKPAVPVQRRAWEVDERVLKAGPPKYPKVVRDSQADDGEVFPEALEATQAFYQAALADHFRKHDCHPDEVVKLDLHVMLMANFHAQSAWLSQRFGALEDRVAELEARPITHQTETRQQTPPLIKSTTRVTKHDSAGRIEEFEKIEGRTEELDLLARIEALEARPTMKYAGVWSKTIKYVPGDIVSYAGSSWHSNITSTGVQPGDSNPASWTLMTKRGRDGKDAR